MAQFTAGLLLIVLGSWMGAPPVVLIGCVLALSEGVRQVWVWRGMRGVEYSRRLPLPRGVAGEAVPLDITVWNRKRLPLAWLSAEDDLSARVVVRERSETGDEAALRNFWSLAPFERVTRHFHVVAERRGAYSVGPVRLTVGDLFAREAAVAVVPDADHWLVRPRSVPVTIPESADPWGGERRARHGLIDDRTRYAGVRPYQPGDSLRAIHWRATARLGEPVTRLFEPGRHREVIVALDLQTVEGSPWSSSYDDDAVETMCVAAASLLERLQADGAEVGVAATGYAGAVRPFAYVSPGASAGQLGRCLDLLARLGSVPSAPIERLLTWLLRSIRPGTAFIVLSVRGPASFAPALRRLASSGHPVLLVALGPDAEHAARAARALGIEARVGRLDGPWRTATAMAVGR
jgi:uncharacterized protein (DUF58 family)